MNPEFQLRVLAFANILALIAMGIVVAAAFAFFYKARSYAYSHGIDPTHPLIMDLQRQERGMLAFAGGLYLTLAFVASVGSLVLSHKIAGPLYRLRRHLELVSRRKASHDVNFRARDFFPELAEACNSVMVRVRQDEDKDEKKADGDEKKSA